MNILQRHTIYQASQVTSRAALMTINENENNALLLFDGFILERVQILLKAATSMDWT